VTIAIPKQLGKYTMGRELGRGASSVVYLANDPFAHRDVAIKVYFPDTDMDASKAKLYRKLFFNEAHMAGKLVHPSVLPIYDAGEEGGLRYVVMMYLEGYKPLTDHTRQDNLLPIKKVVEVFFAYQGFGTLLYQAALNTDIYLIEACTMVSVVVVVLTQVASDVMYAWLNPRMSFRASRHAAGTR